MNYNKRNILYVTIVLEGLLVVFFFIWAWLRQFPFEFLPSGREIIIGLLAALPLFFVNYLLFGPLSERYEALRICFDFKDRIVKPLAAELGPWSSLLVAICAGVGEELFFRGILQTEFGIIIASLLFSFLHFGPATRKYALVALIYALIGFYFGFLCKIFESLWVPILAHVAYDYIALLYMRYVYQSPQIGVVQPRACP